MSKLWEQTYSLDKVIEDFTVGKDHIYDQNLILYDCLGNIAHISMLYKINILQKDEFEKLENLLKQIAQTENFEIKKEDEDVHTAIENFLTQKLGEIGKKIHTGRSRNDQVLLDLRLYSKDNILKTVDSVLELTGVLYEMAKTYSHIPIVGRTHAQRAMPSSIGLWLASFGESLLDNIKLLIGAYDINNQSPLGAGAGYGVNLPLDRHFVANFLDFEKVQNNVLYAINSRGKIEGIIVHALCQIMNDLSRLSSDLIFFSIPEIGYLSLPEKYCPGSSLMPQKRNPCSLELIRAKASIVSSNLQSIFEIIRPLISGYHRDMQEIKPPFMDSFEITQKSLKVMILLSKNLKINEKICIVSFSEEIFATDEVLDLVKKEGISFRDAYSKIKKKSNQNKGKDPVIAIKNRQHIGSTGNLGLDVLKKEKEILEKWHKTHQIKWKNLVTKIIGEIL